jgi:hypothetical protein
VLDDTLFRIEIIFYGTDGRELASRSDAISQGPDYILESRYRGFDLAALLLTPTRYDTQMELSRGEYRLGIAISHGKNFGVTEVPITIEDYDEKALSISSIALCKRACPAGTTPVAPDYVPLTARDYEFIQPPIVSTGKATP